MRTFLPAALLAGFVLPLAAPAFAADLDYPYEPPPVRYERPLPPPIVYPRPVIYPRPFVRLYRPYLPYYRHRFVRVYPGPIGYPGPVERFGDRPDIGPRDYARPYPREDYGRPYSREAEDFRRPREDFREPRDFGGRDFDRPREDYGRRDRYERDDRADMGRRMDRDEAYADRRGPRGDYDR